MVGRLGTYVALAGAAAIGIGFGTVGGYFLRGAVNEGATKKKEKHCGTCN